MSNTNADSSAPVRSRSKVTIVDWIMVLLAIFSVALLCVELFADISERQRALIIRVDLVIIAIFFAEFCWRWAHDDRKLTFPLRYWYEVIGMIPVTDPALRSFRLLRLLRVLVLLSRLGKAMDRVWGEGFTGRLLIRLRDFVVDTISGAVTVRVIDEVSVVLEQGRYTHNLAAAMEEHGDEIEQLVKEKVKSDPAIGRVRYMPFFDEVVATSSHVTQRVVIDLLQDPRMEAIVMDVLKDNIAQIRESVHEREVAKDQEIADKSLFQLLKSKAE